MAAADELVDNEINLEQLKTLKEIFVAADEDGSGELDIDEFCAKLGPHLGVNLKPQQAAQLFMKIDADAGGTVDWDEFTSYMFLEKAQAGADEGDADNWRLFPADFKDKNSATSTHHEQVDKVYFCSAIDKYITCARDGTFRLWQASDLAYVKTVNNGSSWVTDCMYLPYSRKMVFTTMDRAITYYDITRGSYDLIGRVYASGSMGVPLALHVLSGDAGERVVYGDSRGAAVLLLCGSRELPARDLISTETHKDYIYLHEEHSDWITKIQWIPELGLVTSSLDATIKTFDINRERITHTCNHHIKGVHSFVWCHAYSCFASCGMERDVTVWHGTSGRKIGELRGHTSSVSHIALDAATNHVFTLSIDKSIKVWDLRNHRCLQTITQDDWVRQSDSSPTCMMYDSARARLVTACHRPYVWQHKVITQDRTGHKDPVRGALYNAVFSVIVSVDEGGTACVWNLQDGAREGRFNASARCKKGADPRDDDSGASSGGGSNKCVTAISFDKNQRRLVMATNSGCVSVWNFNNGSLLRRFRHDQEPLEVCEVLFAWDEKRSGDVMYAAGWNAKVFVWEDRDEDVVESYKTLEGHRTDILAMAAYAPRQLLATGDYHGRIIIWGLFTGERKSWMAYRSHSAAAGASSSWTGSIAGSAPGSSECDKIDLGLYSGCGASTAECSVERLLWIPAYSPQQRQAAAAAAANLTASAASLAVASSVALSGLASVVSIAAGGADGGRSSLHSTRQLQGQQQQQQQQLVAAASSDSLLSEASLNNLHASQQSQQPHSWRENAPAALEVGADTTTSACWGAGDADKQQQQQQQSQQRPQQQQQQPGARASYEDDSQEEPDALLLLAAGGDGGVRVWLVDRLAQVTPLCSLPGAVGAREVVTASGLDSTAEAVVLGDSTGHLRVLDISGGIDLSSPEAAAASFKERAHWQAHDDAIASVDLIAARNNPLNGPSCSGNAAADSSSSGVTPRSEAAAEAAAASTSGSSSKGGGEVLILSSSRDCNVAVWTLDGGLVGVLGENSWDLDRPSTWKDPQGLAKRPPKQPQQEDCDEDEVLGDESSLAGTRVYSGSSSNSGISKAAQGSSAGSRARHKPGSRHASFAGGGLGLKAGRAANPTSAAQRCSPSKQSITEQQQQQQQRQHQPQQQQAPLQHQQQQLTAELGGLSLASLVMQERKQKQREAMVTCSSQPHCMLHVHKLADIDKAAGLCLKSSDPAKHKQLGSQQQQQQHHTHSVGSTHSVVSRHLGSKPSGASSSWSGWTGV